MAVRMENPIANIRLIKVSIIGRKIVVETNPEKVVSINQLIRSIEGFIPTHRGILKTM